MKRTRMTCPYCGGGCRFNCTVCSGRGGYYKLSPTDGHSFWVSCGNCSGGTVACQRCHGVGTVEIYSSFESSPSHDRGLSELNFGDNVSNDALDIQGISMNLIQSGLILLGSVGQALAPWMYSFLQSRVARPVPPMNDILGKKLVEAAQTNAKGSADAAKINAEATLEAAVINRMTDLQVAELNRITALEGENIHSQTALQVAQQQIETQLKQAYLEIAAQAYLQKNQKEFDWAKHKDHQAFLQNLEEHKLASNRAITEFIKNVDLAINQQTIDFQIWKLEQERLLTVQLRALDAKLTWELREYDRKAQLDFLLAKKELDNLPIWPTIRQILSESDQEIPLRIILSPVILKHRPSPHSANIPDSFPNLETNLETKLSQLANYYSSHGRPVKFFGGAWSDTFYHSESAAQALFTFLKSVPVLILDDEVEGDYFYLRHAFWGINWSDYRSFPLVSQLPWKEVQIEFAKMAALSWRTARQAEETAGGNPVDIDFLYEESQLERFAKHLEILDREEKAKQRRLGLNRIKRNYEITTEEIEESGKYFVVLHCLWFGLLVDEYFLIHAPAKLPLNPLLPELLPSLLQGFPESFLQEAILMIVAHYNNLYTALELKGEASLVPDLRLNLAQTLLQMPQQYAAKEQMIEAINSWLKLRQLGQSDDLNKLLETMELYLTIADRSFVEKLNYCLAILGVRNQLSIANSCYTRGIKHFRNDNYQAAIYEFNQVIEINPNSVEAYSHRGKAYAEVGEYEKAKADLNKVLQLQSH
ncbi:MAG TPA: hypothetical protein DDW76_14890 [Cyanobacteria bacterium UBA11369]|nr:hypothetical protein [Cyanobacteria bacterium UBA11371]HBE16303.1 hypothetical protein [Cyanobacteria bacterium UBA11367]HBE36112.1 hypothetical protein [Cyanobacteria bacterium UBA11368]HBE50044.1 hypothetical protein [Cyanobacteria bacterium UBA11369]